MLFFDALSIRNDITKMNIMIIIVNNLCAFQRILHNIWKWEGVKDINCVSKVAFRLFNHFMVFRSDFQGLSFISGDTKNQGFYYQS